MTKSAEEVHQLKEAAINLSEKIDVLQDDYLQANTQQQQQSNTLNNIQKMLDARKSPATAVARQNNNVVMFSSERNVSATESNAESTTYINS